MSGPEQRPDGSVAHGESDGLGAQVSGVRDASVVVIRQGRAACRCGKWATRLIVVPADVVSVPCPRCGEEARVI
jgi:hypothetical protein